MDKPRHPPTPAGNCVLQRLLQAWDLSLSDLKAGRYLSRFAQHDGRRAVFFVAQGNRPLYRAGR